LKSTIVAALVISLLIAFAGSASATDVVFGLSYRVARPAEEVPDPGSNFKANLGIKLDISKFFETHMSLKLGTVVEDIADPLSMKHFGLAGELDAIFTLINWQISEDYLLKVGPLAGLTFANGPAYQPDGKLDLVLGAYTRFDFLESFSIDGKIGYGFMSKAVVAGMGMEYAFNKSWFIRADFEAMRKNGFLSISGGYRF